VSVEQAVCDRCGGSLEPGDRLRVLTGVCARCFRAFLSAGGEQLSSYLESLTVPAALLAADQTVLGSNSSFQKMALACDIVGSKIGEVLACMYVPLLGQCGQTIACLLCALKRSVEHTWLTGEGLRDVWLSFPHREESRKRFAVTTEKVDGAVVVLMGPREVC
jgi:hypothetical protein